MTEQNDRLIGVKEVKKLVPVTRTTFWKWSKIGKFPQPVQMPGSVLLWRESDIRKWIADLEAKANG